MGCQCEKPEEQNDELRADEDRVKNLDINNMNIIENNNNNLPSEPTDSFSRYMFEKINALRENPQSFIDMIEKAKKNVTTDKNGVIIYKTSVKVALNNGISAFDEAIEALRKTKPMNKLKFNPNFIIKLPNNEVDVKSKEYFIDQVRTKIDSGIDIKSFWKDIVKDSESCFVLTVVDDSGRFAGNKRNDLLNRDNKYIGISSVSKGKSFACYIALG